MDLDGKEDGSVLLSILNFITGRKAKQNEVEVTVDTSPDTTKVSAVAPPDLMTTKLSARWSKATVAVRAEKGPIVVQPGGRVNSTMKSVTGKSGQEVKLDVIEYWCDENGATPEKEGEDKFKEKVTIKLE